MQRQRMTIYSSDPDAEYIFAPHDQGEWVLAGEAEAEIAALRAQVEWRPIDDDTPHETNVLLGWWREWPEREWETEVGYASQGWLERRNGIGNYSKHGQATHWMPLPPPPGE